MSSIPDKEPLSLVIGNTRQAYSIRPMRSSVDNKRVMRAAGCSTAGLKPLDCRMLIDFGQLDSA